MRLLHSIIDRRFSLPSSYPPLSSSPSPLIILPLPLPPPPLFLLNFSCTPVAVVLCCVLGMTTITVTTVTMVTVIMVTVAMATSGIVLYMTIKLEYQN